MVSWVEELNRPHMGGARVCPCLSQTPDIHQSATLSWLINSTNKLRTDIKSRKCICTESVFDI